MKLAKYILIVLFILSLTYSTQAQNNPQIIGAYLTRLQNYPIGEDIPLTWTQVIQATDGYFNPAEPTKIYIVQEGWYWVGADITTLGTWYGGQNNKDVILAVLKNWDGASPNLSSMILAERFGHTIGTSAQLNSILQLVYLHSGDYLQLILQNPNGTSFLVESNPSDGQPSGYLNDVGAGTVSPHFYIIKMP